MALGDYFAAPLGALVVGGAELVRLEGIVTVRPVDWMTGAGVELELAFRLLSMLERLLDDAGGTTLAGGLALGGGVVALGGGVAAPLAILDMTAL